ncbi:MAG: DUF4388 domain-containing protein [Acidobacteriota bacterium]
MIEQGTLKDISTAELLLQGFTERLTGVLYLKREEILKEIYLREGKLVWAVSNSDVDMLENILVSENKVDAQTISLLKSESKNLVDLGKSLVEKGILSFEEFVSYSKNQLDKILTSVLKWSDGVYYFSKDVPAETYISLEIDLKEYIRNFILNQLDMGFIWTKIGSLQEELEQTRDETLIEKFDLSKEELELFDKFLGDLSIEMISLNFPGMAKEEILKTIYFFMTAGLLKEKSEHLHESPGESILLSDKDQKVSAELFNEDSISEDIEKINLDPPEIEKSEIPEEKFEIEEDDSPDLSFTSVETEVPEKKEVSLSDQLLDEIKKEDSKKKGKLINVILLLVMMLFIIAGLIFIILSPEDRARLIPGFGNEPESVEVSENEVKPTEVNEKKIITDSGDKETEKKVDAEKDLNNKNKPGKQIDKEKKNIKKEPIKIKKTMKEINPFSKLEQKKLSEAGTIWKNNILSQKYRFSILLEMDCMKDSVMNAYKQSGNSKKFLILNINRGNRQCYLVLFGIYKDKESAERSMNNVPQYFWKQTNPPKVLDLTPYL